MNKQIITLLILALLLLPISIAQEAAVANAPSEDFTAKENANKVDLRKLLFKIKLNKTTPTNLHSNLDLKNQNPKPKYPKKMFSLRLKTRWVKWGTLAKRVA